MKMEPIVSSETSAIRTQAPGNYPKRNNLQNYNCVYFNIHAFTQKTGTQKILDRVELDISWKSVIKVSW